MSVYQTADAPTYGSGAAESGSGLRVYGFDNDNTEYVNIGVSDGGSSIFTGTGFSMYFSPNQALAAYFNPDGIGVSPNKGLMLGGATYEWIKIRHSNTQTAKDTLIIGLNDDVQGSYQARSMIVADINDISKNFDHTDQANPTLFIQSATNPDTSNTQWISLTHNTTTGVITSGVGGLTLDNSVHITGGLEVGSNPSMSDLPDGWINATGVYYDTGNLIAKSPPSICTSTDKCVLFDFDNDRWETCELIESEWVCKYGTKKFEDKLTASRDKRLLAEEDVRYRNERQECLNLRIYDFNSVTEECTINLTKQCEITEYHFWESGECYINPIIQCEADGISRWNYDEWICEVDLRLQCEAQEDMSFSGGECVLDDFKQKERLKQECLMDRSKYWDGEECLDIGTSLEASP